MENKKIFIAGRNGMVGSAIERRFKKAGYGNIVGKSSKELDLRNQLEVNKFFETEKPEYVILAAAHVGGIAANIESPADFLYDNLQIQNNIIHSAYKHNVKKLLFLGSSCIYPRMCKQPMKEEELLTGLLEPTNEGYGIAKIAGIKMCEFYNKQYQTNFISVMPCNLYGENDDFSETRSHVVAALIKKFHNAKEKKENEVLVWGTGKARRELMYVDDMADACFYLFDIYNGNQFINIGTGRDYSIKELAMEIANVVGYKGDISFDISKPDGMPQKLLDVTRINELGWKAKVDLHDGLVKTYQYYMDHII